MTDNLNWRTSRYSSGQGGNCVEVADLPGGSTAVRDSKDPAGPILRFGPAEWTRFITAISQDQLS